MSLKLYDREHRDEANMARLNLHVEAPPLGHELEDLTELQRMLIVVHLSCTGVKFARRSGRGQVWERTSRRPVTLTIMFDIDGSEGCASNVVTLC